MWFSPQDLAAFCQDMAMEYKTLQAQKEFGRIIDTREQYLNGFVDYLVTKYATECFNQEEMKHADAKGCSCHEQESCCEESKEEPCEPA